MSKLIPYGTVTSDDKDPLRLNNTTRALIQERKYYLQLFSQKQ